MGWISGAAGVAGGAWKWVSGNFELIALMACTAAVITLWLLYHVEAKKVVSRDNTIVELRTRVGLLEGNQKALTSSLDHCSGSIVTIAAEADKRAKEAAVKLAMAQATKPAAIKWITQYLQAPRPLGVTPCDWAEHLLNEEITSAAH